jgi:hypothetical protein
MPTPPASTKTSLTQRLNTHARNRWPALDNVSVRFRGQFAYLDVGCTNDLGQVLLI